MTDPRDEVVRVAGATLGVPRRALESEAEYRRRVTRAMGEVSAGGSFAAIDAAVAFTIEETRPVATSPVEIRLNLATQWIGRSAPRGLFRRLRYLWTFARSVWVWMPLLLCGCEPVNRVAARAFGPCCDLGEAGVLHCSLSEREQWVCFPGESAEIQACGERECPLGTVCMTHAHEGTTGLVTGCKGAD